MKIEMVTSEMKNIMDNYMVSIFPKDDYTQEGVFYEAVDVMHQFNEDIYNWLDKDLEPGKFINIPDEYIDDTINKINFKYRIMRKFKLDRKEYKNNYTMYGHNFYATREKFMKAGFKLVDSYYNDEGNTTGSVLEKNDELLGISIPGLKPHPSMDDILMTFNQNLFKEMGRLFPYLWMEYTHQHPMFITKSFRFCDLYSVE